MEAENLVRFVPSSNKPIDRLANRIRSLIEVEPNDLNKRMLDHLLNNTLRSFCKGTAQEIETLNDIVSRITAGKFAKFSTFSNALYNDYVAKYQRTVHRQPTMIGPRLRAQTTRHINRLRGYAAD